MTRWRGISLPPIAGGSDWPFLGDGTTFTADAPASDPAAAGSANTKGSWVQAIASTPFPSSGIMLSLMGSSGSGTNFLVDVGIGGSGSEQVLISNLAIFELGGGTWGTGWASMFLPVAIPASTRIAVRAQANVASRTCRCRMNLIAKGRSGPALGTFCDTYGALTATSLGTAVTGASSGVWGSWTQLSASLSRTTRWLALLAAQQSADEFYHVRFGLGSSGNEKNLGIEWVTLGRSGLLLPSSFSAPIALPAGERLSAAVMTEAGSSQALQLVAYAVG